MNFIISILLVSIVTVFSKNIDYREYQVVVPEQLDTSDLENYDIINGDVPTPDPDVDFESELEIESGDYEEASGSLDCSVCEQRLKFCKMMCYTEECKLICGPLFDDCVATCTCQ